MTHPKANNLQSMPASFSHSYQPSDKHANSIDLSTTPNTLSFNNLTINSTNPTINHNTNTKPSTSPTITTNKFASLFNNESPTDNSSTNFIENNDLTPLIINQVISEKITHSTQLEQPQNPTHIIGHAQRHDTPHHMQGLLQHSTISNSAPPHDLLKNLHNHQTPPANDGVPSATINPTVSPMKIANDDLSILPLHKLYINLTHKLQILQFSHPYPPLI